MRLCWTRACLLSAQDTRGHRGSHLYIHSSICDPHLCWVRLQAQAEADLQCGHVSQYQRELAPSKNIQAWAEAIMQRSYSCVEISCRADLGVRLWFEHIQQRHFGMQLIAYIL